MTAKSSNTKKPAEQVVKGIRRATRRHFSAEDKIRIVLDGLRGEDSIAELCRKEGIAQSRVWNRIPASIHDQIIEMALEQSELSPRELAVQFTDEKGYFVSEASVYRLLKAHDLITSPAYVLIKAANAFHTKTVRANEM